MDEETIDSGVFEAQFEIQTNEVNDITIYKDNDCNSEPELLFDDTVIEALKKVASEIDDHSDENTNGKWKLRKKHEH